MILAIDTTNEPASIALVEGTQVIEEIVLESADGYAHVLFSAIDELLTRRGIPMSAIDVFAAASGPGSFTGVRVGLTAVKGLAEATGRKVVAVSNLQALASLGSRELRAVVMDARRGEIYGAVYDAALNVVQDEVVMKYDEWIAGLPVGDVERIASGIDGAAPRALAAAIGKIAAKSDGVTPEAIDANYVRRSDAELLWRDR